MPERQKRSQISFLVKELGQFVSQEANTCPEVMNLCAGDLTHCADLYQFYHLCHLYWRVYTQSLSYLKCAFDFEKHTEYLAHDAVNDVFLLDWINIEESGSDFCVLQCGIICSVVFKCHCAQ